MINELYRLTWYDIEIKKENDERNFSTQFTCKDQYCVVALRCCNDQATELVQMQLLSPFSEHISVFQIRIWARNRGGVSGLPMYNIRVQSNTFRVKEYIYIYMCVCACVCVCVRACVCVSTLRSTVPLGKRVPAQLVKNLLYIAIFAVTIKFNSITLNTISIVQTCHYDFKDLSSPSQPRSQFSATNLIGDIPLCLY